MSYKFSGPMPGYKSGGNKGIMRRDKKRKREEAEARNKAYKKKLSSNPAPQEPIAV